MRGGAEGAAQVQKLRSELDHTGGSIKAVGEHSRTSAPLVGGFENSLRKAAGALVLTGAGFVAYQKAKQAVDWTVELTKKTDAFSKVTHMSTQESSTWVATAEALGVNASKLQMVFAKVSSEAVKQSESTGKSVTTFDRLGISSREARDHLNDFPGTMELVLKKLDDPRLNAVEKTALQTKLFGRSWSDLAPLLDGGAEAFKRYTDMAAKFGLSLSGDQQEKLQKLHDVTVEERFAMEGLRLKFTELIVGPLSGVIKGFNELAGAIIKGEWRKAEDIVDSAFRKFNASAEKWLPRVTDFVAEKVLPRVAEAFAKAAPKALESFWNGFQHASLGGQAIIGATLLAKLGVTDGLFSKAGGSMGGVFSKAFAAGVITFGIIELLGGPKEWQNAGETLYHAVFGGYTKAEKEQGAHEEAERQGFLKTHKPAEEKKHAEERNKAETQGHPWSKGIKDPALRAGVERLETDERSRHHGRLPLEVPSQKKYEETHHGPHVAYTPHGHMASGSWAESRPAAVPLTLPNDPGKYRTHPGSLRAVFDNRPIVVQVNGREIARVNRREGLEAQAQGGE